MTYKKNVEHKQNWQEELKVSSRDPPKIFTLDYRDRDELKLFALSDIHWGHRQCDKDLVKANIDRIAQKEMACIDLGDLIENATRDSVGSGVYEQESIAQEQMEQAVEMYQPIKHLLHFMHPGNHELRTMNQGGVNLTKVMAKMLGVPYAGFGAVSYIMVGNQRYVMYTHHGGSGASTIGGKMNSLLALEKIVNAEIYIQGHTHECIFQGREYMDFDAKSRRLVPRRKYFVNNGAYLDYWGSYGQIKAYSPGTKGNAQLTLSGTKHEVEVSFV